MTLMVALALLLVQPTVIRLEAESGFMEGPRAAAEIKGFSGTGYATDFTADKAKITFKFKARKGIYAMTYGFLSPSGPKGVEAIVNGFGTSGKVPQTKEGFERAPLGKVELVDGENTLSVERGWGYYSLDYVELAPAPPPPKLLPVKPDLITPDPSPEAKRLMEFLAVNYGKRTLSGQYGTKDGLVVHRLTGQWPAVFGADFMDYSPSREAYGSRPKRDTEHWIAAAKKGQILKLSWHWNAPSGLLDRMIKGDDGREIDARWYKGFYTNATTFDVAHAMNDPASEEHKLILRDIDHIAVELKKIQAAKISVLWRPLHEAEGKWFWWGAKGPEPCKKLWRLMVDRLVKHHKINNLIWIWNSVDPAWHPGDDVVDMVAVDAYPSDRQDSLVSTWEDLLTRFNGKKMLALTEFPGPPDVERQWRFGVRWSFFVGWTGLLGPADSPLDLVRSTFASPLTINEEDVKVELRF